MKMRTLRLAIVLLPLACDSAADATAASKRAADEAVEASKKAADGAVAAGKQAVDASEQAVNAGKKAVDDARTAADDAKKWWDDIPSSGELSEQTKTWLANAAKDGERTIENVVVEGEQYAPTAIEVGTALASAVDSNSGFEPIYVKVDDRKEADEKIGDMPKVQVVDELTIGLKRVDSWEGLTQKKERGYLILWREDDHLVGFVYRSRRELDLEKVAAETPRLVGLVRKAIAGRAAE